MNSPSQKVMIYMDALSEEIQEGEAILLRFLGIDAPTGLQRWVVRFLDPSVNPTNVERLVKL